jgi:hypothetical protein
VDFGEAHIILNGQESTVAYFVMSLPYSDAFFCCVFPRECTETFLEGHRRAFDFFGGVPRRISYDNSRIAVKRIMLGRERELTHEFLRLQSHYLFVHHFCLVRGPYPTVQLNTCPSTSSCYHSRSTSTSRFAGGARSTRKHACSC